MLNEWTDRLTPTEAAEVWRRSAEEVIARHTRTLEHELRELVAHQNGALMGFYKAIRSFLTLRETLFPDFPADPAWKILVTLALTPDGSDKASVTGTAAGAEVPLTTALRYIAVMEAQGIVERVPHATDKRQVMLRLTREGHDRLDRIAHRWNASFLVVFGVVGILLYLCEGLYYV